MWSLAGSRRRHLTNVNNIYDVLEWTLAEPSEVRQRNLVMVSDHGSSVGMDMQVKSLYV